MPDFAHAEAQDSQRARASTPVQDDGDEHELLKLQRLAGNAAVSFLVQRQDPGDAGQDQSGAGGGGGGAGGGSGMMQMIAMSKPGMVSITLQDGKVTAAGAKVGDI